MPGLYLDAPQPQPQQAAPSNPVPYIGDANLNRYVQYYNDLVAANGGSPQWGASQDLSGINRGAPANFGGIGGQMMADGGASIQQQQQEPTWAADRGTRDMSTVDKFFANVGKLGEAVAGSSGFNGWDSEQGVAENAARFAMSLPTGMASAPFSGAASLYEGISGNAVTEGNLETGEMPGDELTGFQRAGAIGTGLVDTLGLFLGGSAEALSAGRNVLRAARGADAAAPIGAAASKFMGRGAGAIAVDTAEEAGEEAFQSVMEDIRHDRLDEGSVGRALEGAAYGAVGGAVMSGGGQAINSALGSSGPTTTGTDMSMSNIGQAPETEWGRNLSIDRGTTYTRGFESAALEKMSENNEQPGGINAVQVTSLNELGLNDAEAGQQLFTNVTQSSVQGSLDSLARTFDVLVNSYDSKSEGVAAVKKMLTDISMIRDVDERTKRYQDMVDRNGGIVIKVNRTPNSNPGEISDFRVRKVNNGAGISLHPLAWTMYGSDVDGDRMTVFFNKDIQSQGFITSNLTSANGNRLNYSTSYASFHTGDKDLQEVALEYIDASIDKIFPSQFDQPGQNTAFDLKREFEKAYSIEDKDTRNLAIASAINGLRGAYIKSMVAQGQPESASLNDAADSIVSDLMTGLVREVSTSDSALSSIKTQAEEDVTNGINLIYENLEYSTREDLEGGGSIGDSGAIQAMLAWGVRIAQTTTKNNPFYRQFPQIYALTQERGGYSISDGALFSSPARAFDTLFAHCFRMVDVAFDVESAIESVYQIAIQDKVIELMGGRRLGAGGSMSFDEFIDVFLDARNQVAKEFNDAWDSQNTRKDKAPMPGAPNKKTPTLDKSDRAAVARELLDVFGGFDITNIAAVGEEYKGQRIIDLIEEDAATGQVSSRFALGDFESMWRSMIFAVDSRSAATATRIESMLSGYANDIRQWVQAGEIAIDSNGKIVLDPISIERISWMVQAFQEVFGYETAFELGIHSVEGFVDSTWGRNFLSGDTDSTTNSILSVSLTSLYSEVFEVLDDYHGDDVQAKARAETIIKQKLTECQSISFLHDIIYTDFFDNGRLDYLVELTDLSVSFADKKEKFNLVTGPDVKGSALLDYALRTSSSRVEMSKMSQSLKRSQSAWHNASIQMGITINREVDILDEVLSGKRTTLPNTDIALGYDDFFSFVKYYAKPYMTEFSTDILGAAAYEAGRVSKPAINKGDAKDTSQSIYLENVMAIYGEQIASLDVMPISMGTLSKDSLLTNRTALLTALTDKDAEFEVWDPSTDHRWTVTHRGVYEAFGIVINGDQATGVELMELIKKVPQLATYIVPQTFNVTYSGSSASVSHAMSQMPLNALIAYKKSLKDPDSSSSKNRARQYVKSKIMGNQRLLATVFASDSNLGTYGNPYEARRSIESALEVAVDSIMHRCWLLSGSYAQEEVDYNTQKKRDHKIIETADRVLDQIASVAMHDAEVGLGLSEVYADERYTQNDIARSVVNDFLEESIPGFKVTDETSRIDDPVLDEKLEEIERKYIAAQVAILGIVGQESYLEYQANEHDAIVENARKALESLSDDQIDVLEREIGREATAENLASVMYEREHTFKYFAEILDGPEKDFVVSDDDEISDIYRKAEIIIDACMDQEWSDYKKKLDKIFEKYPQSIDYEGLYRIRVELNNISLINILAEMGAAYAADVNIMAAYQEAKARTYLDDAAAELFEEMKKEGISPYRTTDRIQFYFEDPVHGFCFTDAEFDLGGGAIPSLIQNNATKVKVHAAAGIVGNLTCGNEITGEPLTVWDIRRDFNSYRGMHYVNAETGEDGYFSLLSALPTDPETAFIVYHPDECLCGCCKQHGRKVNANAYSHQLGDIMRDLVDHTMEPIALQRKKKVGDRDCVYTPMIGDIYTPKLTKIGNGDMRHELARLRQNAVNGVADEFQALFDSDDYAKLSFNTDEAMILSSFCVQFIEVHYEVNGMQRVACVPSMALASDESFSKFSGLLGGDGVTIIGAKPMVFSIDEACSHILRKIDKEYWTGLANGEYTSEDNISSKAADWCKEALMDYDSYSERGDLKELFQSIPYRPYTNHMGMFPTNPSTPMMSFLGINLNEEFAGRSYDRHSRIHRINPLTEDQNSFMHLMETTVSESSDNDFGDYVVSYATIDDSYRNSESISDRKIRDIGKPIDARHPIRQATGLENKEINIPMYNERKVAEFFDAGENHVSSAFEEAYQRNHAFIVRQDLVEKIDRFKDVESNPVWKKIKENALNTTIKLGDRTYIVIDPFDEVQRTGLRRIDAVSSWHSVANMGKRYKVLVAHDSPHHQGDSSIIWNPNDEDARRFHESISFGSVDNYFSDPIRSSLKIVGKDEIGSLSGVDDDKIKWDIVDFLAEQQGTKKEKGVYRNAVEAYLNGDMVPGTVSDGDCIGFVKQGSGESAKYAPIFYEGSGRPNIADSVTELRLRNSEIVGIVDASNIDVSKISTKWMFRDFAYKCVGREVSEKVWQSFVKLSGKLGVEPDGYIDEDSANGRFGGNKTRQLGILLHNYTNMQGGNVFFDIDLNKDGTYNAELKPGLRKDVRLAKLLELQSGRESTWNEFVNGGFNIFDADNHQYNEILRVWARRIYNLSGHRWDRVANFLCPQPVEMRGYNRENGSLVVDGEEVAHITIGESEGFAIASKIDATDKDLDMIFHDVPDDTILGLYNLMTNGDCPPSIREGKKNDKWVINENGEAKMADGSRRKIIIELPVLDTGHSEFFSSMSYSGNLSHQAIAKRIMADGYIMGDQETTIGRLSTVVGDYEHMLTSRRQQWIDETLKGIRPDIEIDEEIHARNSLVKNDSITSARMKAYRKECREWQLEFYDDINVIEKYSEEGFGKNAFENEEFYNRMQSKLTQLNKALGYKNDDPGAFSMRDLRVFAKAQFGFSSNSGRGFDSLTASQFEICVDRMIRSVEETGFLIDIGKHGYYIGARGDIRVPIGLLPANIITRLYNAPGVRAKLASQGINSRKEYLNKIVEQCKDVTMPFIASIENRGKRLALMKMMDAASYSNGIDTISGHILGKTYMADLMATAKRFGTSLSMYDAKLADKYDEYCQLSEDYFAKLERLSKNRSQFSIADDNAWGGLRIMQKGTDDSVVDATLRNLATARRAMGIANIMMLPANVLERGVNQGLQSAALKLGQAGIGVYATDFKWVDYSKVIAASKSDELVKLYAAYRTAELLGIDREFLVKARDSGDIDAFIREEFKKHGNAFDRYTSMLMDFMSGGKFMIDGQIRNFIDRFAMEAYKKAEWWMVPIDENGTTLLEERIASDPAGWFIDIMNGTATNHGADVILARQCMNWAKRGDMAQRNLVSAIYTELARRSSKADFITAAFISPYFQYATNRLGRVLQWVAPISSFHYLAVNAVTNGFASEWNFFGTGLKFKDMAFEDVQMQSDLREALTLDVMHLGPQLLALMLLGMGAFEPPEDEDKWGNFKEWTFCGMRVDANWWVEDILGLAIPYACFGASVREGKPRVDLLANGLAYYLSNNPVTKVSDAVEALFDPFAELSRWYDEDVEGYAKAMGGPPTPTDMIMGRATSFGLSFASQFITPGFLREIYNGGQEWEKSYKRIYKVNATGAMETDAEGEGLTEYTTYSDAMVRKMTRNNPVMGFLADMMFHPETGYMAHEMPRTVIYDPFQMNSLEHFSLYNDPFNKKDEKTDIEKDAIAIEVIATLQSNDVDTLAQQGFALDYETKQYVSKYIWDMIATLNQQWNEFQQSDYSDYYVAGNGDFNAGKKIISQLKAEHYSMVNAWKSLYSEKLWSKEFSVAKYNRKATRYAQDANGDFYATGMTNQPFFMPVTFGSMETPEGFYKTNMGKENDWQSESIVTGLPTGERNLVPISDEVTSVPDINSWSTDGTETGKSDRANASLGTASNTNQGTGSDTNGTGYPSDSSSKGSGSKGSGRRSSGGGGRGSRGGSRRSGGGGSGGSFAPNIYSHVNAPNISNPDTMRSTRIYDTNYDALRPDFQTKGSREAYKRSDI